MQQTTQPRQRSTPIIAVLALALISVIIFVATRSKATSGQASTPFARGKQIYHTVCIACHHLDPSKEYGTAGTFGPPIAGSSFELIEMRVLSTSYPQGYKPKRDTQLMTTFDMNESDLRALHTFVNHPDTGGDAGK